LTQIAGYAGDSLYNLKWLCFSGILLILHSFKYTKIFRNLKIGDIFLGDRPLFLAPDGRHNRSFVQDGLPKRTELISCILNLSPLTGLIRDGQKSVRKLDIYDYERPIGIQLYRASN